MKVTNFKLVSNRAFDIIVQALVLLIVYAVPYVMLSTWYPVIATLLGLVLAGVFFCSMNLKDKPAPIVCRAENWQPDLPEMPPIRKIDGLTEVQKAQAITLATDTAGKLLMRAYIGCDLRKGIIGAAQDDASGQQFYLEFRKMRKGHEKLQASNMPGSVQTDEIKTNLPAHVEANGNEEAVIQD